MARGPVLIGLVLTVIIAASWVVAPRLRSEEAFTADAARERAELAQRKLSRHSATAAHLGHIVNEPAFEGADLAAAAERAGEMIQDANKRLSPEVGRAIENARLSGLPELQVVQTTATESGLRQAVKGFRDAQQANEALLASALADAKAAAAENDRALGVQFTLGLVESRRAAELLGAAEEIRNELAGQRVALLSSAIRLKEDEGRADYFNGIEVTEVINGLRRDQAELDQLKVDAGKELATMRTELEQREAELAKTESALRDARARLIGLEQRGFRAGDDASFAAYREEYQRISDELRILEEQELEQRHGVRRGATLAGEDLLESEIVGGEPTDGVEKMRTRLEIAEERAKRLGTAQESIAATIAAWSDATEKARADAQRIRTHIDELRTAQTAIVESITKLNAAAVEKEDQALAAANAATRAFQSAQAALDNWVSTAQEAQQLDTNGKNERLKLITGDQYYRLVAASAEAAGLALEGRIYAIIIEANQALIDDMKLYATLDEKFTFDDTPFQERINTSRTAALDKLGKAVEAYSQKLTRGPDATKWVPQATLATVHQLIGRIAPERAAEQKQKALDTLGQALAKREQSPYLREYVRLREFLGGAAPPPTDTAPAGDADKKPAEPPPGA